MRIESQVRWSVIVDGVFLMFSQRHRASQVH